MTAGLLPRRRRRRRLRLVCDWELLCDMYAG